MYNLGMVRTVLRLQQGKKEDKDIINELCRLYSLHYKKAQEIIDYVSNIEEA